MAVQIVIGKPGDSLYLGNEITVKVLDVQGLQVRVEIETPGDATLLRRDLADRGSMLHNRVAVTRFRRY